MKLTQEQIDQARNIIENDIKARCEDLLSLAGQNEYRVSITYHGYKVYIADDGQRSKVKYSSFVYLGEGWGGLESKSFSCNKTEFSLTEIQYILIRARRALIKKIKRTEQKELKMLRKGIKNCLPTTESFLMSRKSYDTVFRNTVLVIFLSLIVAATGTYYIKNYTKPLNANTVQKMQKQIYKLQNIAE